MVTCRMEAPVLSGVPLFINNITENVSSPIRLLADDCLIYREIQSPSDCNLLQKDLDTLVKWSKTWGMMFNIKKCSVISITNATKTRSIISTRRLMSLSTPLTGVFI